MSQATLAWAAFKNMMRQAARDPLWALVQIIFAPIRGGIYLVKFLAGLAIIVLVLGFCFRYLLQYAGYPPGTVVSLIGDIVVGVIALVLLFRALTNPMILHFRGRFRLRAE